MSGVTGQDSKGPSAGDEITLTEHSGSGSDGFAPPRPSCAVWVERGYLHEEDETGRQVREATRVEKLLGAEIDRLKRDLYNCTLTRTRVIEIERVGLEDLVRENANLCVACNELTAERDRLRTALAKFTNPSRCPADCVAIAREALEGVPAEEG